MKKTIFSLILCLFLTSFVPAQNAPEVTVTLNEQFLNSFLDAVFTNLDTPKFQFAAKKEKKSKKQVAVSYQPAANGKKACDESVTLLRENGGVKTSVRFADGKMIAPLAFTGTKDIPFVGCSTFRGWAEAVLNLEYDREKQILYGRVKVNKVDLDGVPGLASGIVAKFVQGSIDSRINPVEILRADQVSAIVPVRYANGSLRVRAVDMKPEIVANALNVRVTFVFAKAE